MRPLTAGSRICRGPGERRRRSPTARGLPSGSSRGCSPKPRNGTGSCRRRAPRRTGSPLRCRPRPSGSPPRSRKPRDERAELASAYRSYLAGLTELRVADPDELIDALEAWAATGTAPTPAVAAIDDAARAAGAELGRLEAGLSARRAAHAEHAVELEAEIERLRAGGHDAPPVPHTRAPGVRDDRPGAPLWKVTDFAPDVPDEHRAGLEAALEAAGILDAWVTPDGNLVDGDVTVVSGLAPVPGPSCASVLVPAIDSGDPQAGALSDGGRRRRPGRHRAWRDRRDVGSRGRPLGERRAERRLAEGQRRLYRRGSA